MANAERDADSTEDAMGDKRPSKAKRAVKTGIILAAAGLTALAISKGMKTRKGKAAAKKLRTKAKAGLNKTARKVKAKARTAIKRATTGTRRTSKAR